MFAAGAFADSRYRSEEDLLTKRTHLAQKLFELAVVSNALLVKFQQRYVKSHRRSLQRQAICLAI
jgi:hypothetical protein